ncbi:cytochrome P450 9e2-like [Pseudomyrmex gracilis]|uniref:cytochrome P450 9e2-like n=1 Tax=Pseudomyrmex gracilis TaxID=219809 RepID=UPI0009956581|nr:cytochrome P450 9e2-like [Pseudomyrmex gracilis]
MAVTYIFLIVVALIVLYLYLTRNYKYWQKRGIPCPDGIVPGVGHFWDFLSQKISLSECCRKLYNANQGHSMVGIYNFTSPMLMVRDPNLVKTVLQTKFTSFHENALKIDPELDPLLANNPFFTYGDKWMTGRKRLTYAFSSMRLKILLETVKQVCEKFENFLDRKLNKSGKVEMELKDLFARFTAQVVSSAGFGVDGMCFDDEKERESFYAIGKSFLEPSVMNTLVFTLTFFLPIFGKIFKVRFIPKKTDRFFRSVLTEVIEQRRIDSTPRNDFLQLMVDLERTENQKFDIQILTSHAVSFFVDGYETSSNVLSFVGFQLASHPKVQNKLREEVVSVLEKYDGVITYDTLKEMTYMDQVISESQRTIPALGFMTKICTEECELKGSDGLVCRVQPGTEILIPVHGLQEDPRYWENPQVFDPERFSPENKHNIEKFAFLPFGEGPRICVGMRMALLQIKACLATLLRKYSLELSPKTRVPLKISTSGFLTAAEGGLWAYIRPLEA